MFEEYWNQGDLSLADEIYAPEHVRHDPSAPTREPEGEKQLTASIRAAFPDLQLTLEHLIAEGDMVACHWIGRGTHQGELWGIARTGKQWVSVGTAIVRFSGSKIVEAWANWDALGMLQQLGVQNIAELKT